MPYARWFERAAAVPGAAGVLRLPVAITDWHSVAADAAAAGARLLALWATPPLGRAPAMVRAALFGVQGILIPELTIEDPGQPYPGLQDLFPAADRMQRAAFDLAGVRADGPDQRPWLRHAAWPRHMHPLQLDSPLANSDGAARDDYPFVRVEGEGVHEIPVGPVHAGTIEPGHFRFSVVGEKVLKLEVRLGYAHKGLERRFAELPLLEGHRLAARVCGDSAVAFSWAYCQALEGLAGVNLPARALWLRALCLEIERVQNHLGDLGALGNDAGFAFGLAQFSRLKEELLRDVERALGQRYLLDAIVPGGVSFDLATSAAVLLAERLSEVAASAAALRAIYDEHAGVRDRFAGAGQVTPALARRLGLLGLAGRASGQEVDLRVDMHCEPYPALAVAKQGGTDGDVAARVDVRFDELAESCRLGQRILAELPAGAHRAPVAVPAGGRFAIGLMEGWRGPVLVALESAPDGAIKRCHPHDSSWTAWPVIEHAIIGNIVPDFPLINKSFNLSYSGHDL